jgi:hypothetical protein
MRADLRKHKPRPSPRKRRIVRNSDSIDEDEDEAMVGGPEPLKPPAQVQGKSEDK